MEKLESKKYEMILAYLYSENEWLKTIQLSTYFNWSRAMLRSRMNLLLEKGYIEQKIEGRLIEYQISESGKKYIEEHNIHIEPKDNIEKEEELNNASVNKVKEVLGEIEVIRDVVEKHKEEVDKNTAEIKITVNALDEKINKIERMTENFYGKIGEIITLLIASISIIVFNIKVMDSTKIDFSTGYRQAFLNIMAIDLPLIVLLVVATVLFHYIVGKELKLKNLIVAVVIIIVCMGTLLI